MLALRHSAVQARCWSWNVVQELSCTVSDCFNSAPSCVWGCWGITTSACVAPLVNKGPVQPRVAPGVNVDSQHSLISSPKDHLPGCLQSDGICTWHWLSILSTGCQLPSWQSSLSERTILIYSGENLAHWATTALHRYGKLLRGICSAVSLVLRKLWEVLLGCGNAPVPKSWMNFLFPLWPKAMCCSLSTAWLKCLKQWQG